MAGEIGAQSRLLFDVATPFDSSSIWFEFLSESITQSIPILNSAGIRGTRQRASERNRRGNERVSGSIEFEASRILLDNLLPCALGANEDTNVFNLAETVPDFYLLIDKGFDIALVSECKIGQMRFSFEQSQIVKVSIDIEAESVTWGQSWPGSPPSPDVSKPYFHSDLADVTIESSAREILGGEVTIDNALSADQWANNLTRDELIHATDLIVQNNLQLPARASNAGLVSHAIAGEAISLAFTNADEASSILTIALGRVTYEAATATVNGKGQLVLPLSGEARALGHAGATANAIRITNAHA